MSNALYPQSLPGITCDLTRTPVWSTTIKTAVSQREFRFANVSYPVYKFKLVYEVLRQRAGLTEFSQLVGFFNARQGSFDSFLYVDKDDNTVAAQVIGVGDGANKLFQLVRTFGGYVEPVFDVNSAPQIFLNGVLKATPADYSISTTGLVTFVAAPGAGVSVTWTGTYYRRMRFSLDYLDFHQFMRTLWELKTVELITAKP